MRQTPLAQLVETKLGRSLREYVVAARNSPDVRARSWRSMAAALSEETGVAVTHETLRAWFTDELMIVLRDDADTARASA